MKPIILAYCAGKAIHHMTDDAIRMLSGINLAFGNVKDDAFAAPDFGEDLSVIAKYRKINPDLYVTVSMGGAGRGGYSTAARTAEGRAKLAATTIAFIRQQKLDGVDLDWEFPCHPELGVDGCPEDEDTYALLLEEFRKQLDEAEKEDGKHYMLTIAGGSCEDFLRCSHPERYAHLLDYIQIMTYDIRLQTVQFELPEGRKMSVGHHTCLYTTPGDEWNLSVDTSVQIYRRWGIPPEKIIIGSALYNKHWNSVPDVNHGLLQIPTTDPDEHFGPEDGVPARYDVLEENYINKNGFVRYWDEDAKAPYLYNAEKGVFITYDDPESIEEKCKYLLDQGLLGIMYWEHSCDPTHKLLKAHYDALNK